MSTKKYTHKDIQLKPGLAFTADGFKHPSNWASIWTEEDFERWGVTVEEVPDPAPTPVEPTEYWVCTPRQARMALLQAGLLPAVEAAVAEAGELTKIQWEYATEVRRDDPNIIALAQGLGIEDQLPALFALAVTL